MFGPDKREARLEFGPERNKWQRRRWIGSLLIVVLLAAALPRDSRAHLITGSPSSWLETSAGGRDVSSSSNRFLRSRGEILGVATRDAVPLTQRRQSADELIEIRLKQTGRQQDEDDSDEDGDKQQDLEVSSAPQQPATLFASSARIDSDDSIRAAEQKPNQLATPQDIVAGQPATAMMDAADSNDMGAALNQSSQFESVITTTTTTTIANTTSDPGEANASQPLLELGAFEAAQLGFFRHSPPVSVILTIAYSLVFILGIVGNSLVVAIVCKSPRMRTVTNYFIANLALADILVVVFCLPVTLLGNLFVPYVLGEFVCKTVSYLQGVAVSASINTMVTVTLDRFLAICFPMDWHMSRRMARCTIACIWLFSMTIALPWAMYFTLVPYTLERHTIQVCAEEWPSERMGKIYFVCANLILLYLFPAFVIIVCYLGIWYKIERRSIPGDGQKGPKIELIMQRSKLKVIKMMMLVVVIFLLSWLPLYLIFARVKLAEDRNSWEDTLITAMMPLAQWLGASNSCINPILYTFFNKKYKHGFINLLRLIFCCRRRSPSSTAGFMAAAQFATSANQLGRAATSAANGFALEPNSTNHNQAAGAAWRHQNGFCCPSGKLAANKMPAAMAARCRGSTQGKAMHRAAAMRLHSFSMETSLQQPEDDQLKALADCSSGAVQSGAVQSGAPPEEGNKNNKQNRPQNNGLERQAGINQETINGADMQDGNGKLAGDKVVGGPATWRKPSGGNSRPDYPDCNGSAKRITSEPSDSNQIQAIERIPLDDRSLFRRGDQGELSVVLRLGGSQAGLEPDSACCRTGSLRKQRAQTFHCGVGVCCDESVHRYHHHRRHHHNGQLNQHQNQENCGHQHAHGHHRRRLKTDSPSRGSGASERTPQQASLDELEAEGNSRSNQNAPSDQRHQHHDHHHNHHHHHKHHKHHRHRHEHQATRLVAANGSTRGSDKQLEAVVGEAELITRSSRSMSTASVQLNRSASRDAAAAHHHKYHHNHNRHHHHHHHQHHHHHRDQHQRQQPATPLEHSRHRKESPAATAQAIGTDLDGGQTRMLAEGSEPAAVPVARDGQTTKMSHNKQANDLGDHQIEPAKTPRAAEGANRTEINAEPQGRAPT